MKIFEWYFVEELEHRAVAFDVYDHVCGGYLYRLVVGMWAQWYFTRWIRRATKYMLKANPQPKSKAEEVSKGTKAVPSIRPASVGNLLPGLLRIYLPNYTPHDL
jgi:predicted metal-dependent hydrolase